MITCINELDLESVLGNAANVDELRRLLTVIGETCFTDLPSQWRNRGTYRSLAPGRSGKGADFVYYNPWTRTFVSREDARALARRQRYVPDGNPVGWDYSQIPDGWVTPEAVRPVGELKDDGWEGDVPEDVADGVVSGGIQSSSGAPVVPAPVAAPVFTDGTSDLESIRRFLRDVVVEPENLQGSCEMLVGYVRGLMH